MTDAPHRAVRALLVPLLLAGALAACGAEENGSATAGVGPNSGEVLVSAAASLKQALTTYGERFDGGAVRLSFAGSDELAAQIRQGIRPDVFAAADVKLPEQLFEEGFVERPVRFATNELVLAVPAAGGRVASLEELGEDGATIALGAEGVPVGEYTRTVLDRLPATRSQAILANVRSREPDAAGIVGKLTQGAVDAGFVYRSDVTGAGGRLTAIALPDALKPTVEYGVAVVKGARNRSGGRAFVDGLLEGAGAAALRGHGFGPPAGT